MRLDPSLLLCFDPRTSLYHTSDSHLSSVIHNDLPTDSDASEQPKMAQTPPMVTGIEITAGGMSSGDVGDDEDASVYGCPHGLHSGWCNCRG